MIPYVLASAFAIMLASLSGAAFTAKRYGPWTERNLKYLIAFSIGVFAVITFGLFREAFEEVGLVMGLAAAIGGAVALELASIAIPKAHHHHGITTDHGHSRLDARRMLLGDAVHNFGDGLVLVPAFAISVEAGLIAAAGILVHELVQEISEYFVLRDAGYTNGQALAKNFIASSTILLGVALSLALSSVESVEAPLVAFAAGGFLHIVLRDLVPHTLSSMKRDRARRPYAAALIAGVALMSAVSLIAPHEHPHVEGHDEGEEPGHEEEIVAPLA